MYFFGFKKFFSIKFFNNGGGGSGSSGNSRGGGVGMKFLFWVNIVFSI